MVLKEIGKSLPPVQTLSQTSFSPLCSPKNPFVFLMEAVSPKTQLERERNHRRPLIIGNQVSVAGGEGAGGWGDGGVDIGEGVCCNDHWLLYKTDQS